MITKRKKTAIAPWRTTLKGVVRLLNKGDYNSKALWNVLSALRGPDDTNDTTKNCTTAVIRKAIGLRGEPILPAHVEYDSQEHVSARQTLDQGLHFQMHARYAFSALDLEWNGINKLPGETK